MTRTYDIELDGLRRELLLMAGRVEEMIRTSTRALVERDEPGARRTIQQDRLVNRAEIEIDELCRRILADHQLAATDLRFVTLAFKMVVDLERIGDLAVNISERVLATAAVGAEAPWDAITQMSDLTRSIVKEAIDAFVDRDADKARSVIDRDDEVDALYIDTFRLLLDHMARHPSALEWGIHLLSVIKWLERMSDHGTNLAEQVVLLVEGTDIRHAGKLDSDRRSK